MNKHYIFLFILIFLCSCSTVKENDEDLEILFKISDSLASSEVVKTKKGKKITQLKDLVDLALKNNPQIKSARYKWKATAEKYPQATSLPDPVLTYTFFLKEPETRVGPQRHKVSIMQYIPFPRKLYLKGEMVKDNTKIAHLAYERTIRDVLTKVQKHFYELVYIESAIEITKKNEDLVSQLIQVASVENSNGKAPLSDLMKGQSQLAQLGYDRIRLEELRQVEIGQLNALLSQNPQDAIQLDNLIFDEAEELQSFEALQQYALVNNQEILASKVAITKADHQLALAFSEYFPDFSIGASWTQVDRTLSGFNFDFDDDGQDISAITFGINLPIWIPKRSARVRESKYNINHTKETRKNIENQLAAELKKVYYKVSNSKRLIKLYKDRLLPEANNSIQISENWYRDGEKSLLTVIESQSVWLNFSLALARAQSDYAQGIVTLSQLCGGSLPQALAEEK
ncbi:TolC family protein [Candidatus Uabimicrobium sp. HlEnr_7]|uniref:TolC family protein n=1 Tax=Candidatus Uabimicrobium helgolandensis TaxID=3095367 RepID=UPI0035577579